MTGISILDVYEAEYVFTEDVEFLLSENLRGPVLEVGCGTGRILKGLSKAIPTNQLYGIDISEESIEIAKNKLDPNIIIENQSAELFLFERIRFGSIIFFFNGFMLLDRVKQKQFLENSLKHLSDNGRLLLSLSNPSLDRMSEKFPAYKYQKTIQIENIVIDKFECNKYDFNEQSIDRIFYYDYVNADGCVKRLISRFKVYYYHFYELELLLRSVGFNDVKLYGGYDKSKFDAKISDVILVDAAL